MTEPELIIDDVEHVRVFRLNRPHRRNALSGGLMAELIDGMARTATEPDVWGGRRHRHRV